MACNCGKSKKTATTSWSHIAPDGKVTVYRSEFDARTAAAREGGRVRPAS